MQAALIRSLQRTVTHAIGGLDFKVEQAFHPHHWGEGLGEWCFHINRKKETAARRGVLAVDGCRKKPARERRVFFGEWKAEWKAEWKGKREESEKAEGIHQWGKRVCDGKRKERKTWENQRRLREKKQPNVFWNHPSVEERCSDPLFRSPPVVLCLLEGPKVMLSSFFYIFCLIDIGFISESIETFAVMPVYVFLPVRYRLYIW